MEADVVKIKSYKIMGMKPENSADFPSNAMLVTSAPKSIMGSVTGSIKIVKRPLFTFEAAEMAAKNVPEIESPNTPKNKVKTNAMVALGARLTFKSAKKSVDVKTESIKSNKNP